MGWMKGYGVHMSEGIRVFYQDQLILQVMEVDSKEVHNRQLATDMGRKNGTGFGGEKGE